MAAIAVGAVADSNERVFSERELLAGCDRLISIRDEVVAKSAKAVNQMNQSASFANARSTNGSLPAPRIPSTQLPNGISKPASAINLDPPQSSDVDVPRTSSSALPPTSSVPQKVTAPQPGTSGIDPIFLTKSTVLVRAEIHQKRQRLEKALEEQILKSQRHKAMDLDALPDFDVTDVLRKAQELVKPMKGPRTSRANGMASSSDSSDEKTFYSSQMDESMTTEEADESQQRRPRPICNFYLRGQRCGYGESCIFSHDPALKRKLAAKASHAIDIDHISTDEQTSPRKDITPNKRPRDNDPHPKPPIKENTVESLSSQYQAERERQERIARLEAELRSAKAEQDAILKAPHQPGKETVGPQEDSAYSPPGPDEFGRDDGLRTTGLRQAPTTAHGRVPSGGQPSAHGHGKPGGNPPTPLSNNVRVVTNHIRSPVAPQPSRVSPLAVAKVPQVSQVQREYGGSPRASNAENSSTGPSPKVTSQPRNSKKRRRGRDSGEQMRNVVPRTDYNSPIIRVKEEPVSPLPFDMADTGLPQVRPRQEASRELYAESSARHHGGERPVYYQPRPVERPSYGQLIDDSGPQTPLPRRVISRNGLHYVASEESDLRRVVTAPRQIRAPMSPAPQSAQYSAPQPRATRAASHVYLSPTGQSVPYRYQAPVQPQPPSYPPHDHSPPPPIRRVLQSPIERPPINMAPPSRRVVVDQWGNRLVEAPRPVERHTSVIPKAHPGDFDPHYEPVPPRGANVARHPQLVRLDEDGHYVRRVPSPTSNGFYEVPMRRVVDSRLGDSYEDGAYATQSNAPLTAYRSDVTRYEEVPEQDGRIVRMHSVRPMENRQEGVPDSDARIIRIQSVRPAETQHEAPREQLMRVHSVRPEQPRIIKLGERTEPGRQVSRQASVFQDNGDSGQVRYAVEAPPSYDYHTGYRDYAE